MSLYAISNYGISVVVSKSDRYFYANNYSAIALSCAVSKILEFFCLPCANKSSEFLCHCFLVKN